MNPDTLKRLHALISSNSTKLSEPVRTELRATEKVESKLTSDLTKIINYDSNKIYTNINTMPSIAQEKEIASLGIEEEIKSNVPSIKEQIEKLRNLNKPVEETITKEPALFQPVDRKGNPIVYNSKQLDAVRTGLSNTPFVLIGAAGTGKTTCQQGVIQNLINSGKAGTMNISSHKYLPKTPVPGIVVIAYTRRAVNNIRNVMPEGMKGNCITYHKLMEYEPVYYDVIDPVSGESRKTMRFEETRHKLNPLPESIKYIIIEEGSMFSTDYYNLLMDACPHKPIIIILGDIQQLPPVFGSAILGYKMTEWKTIELTEVYRQALDSPIISLAHRVLSGVPIKEKEFKSLGVPNALTIHPWKKQISPDSANKTLIAFFSEAIKNNLFNLEEDIILMPFNESCGTLEVNKGVATYCSRFNDRIVWEIIAGYEVLYFSVGDKVLYDKEDAIIMDIKINPNYIGRSPQPESKDLNYWGMIDPKDFALTDREKPESRNAEYDEAIAELMLAQAAGGEDKTNTASHIILLRLLNSEREISISKTAEVKGMLLGYAITVHKAQGSEWRKVFLVFHQSNIAHIQRELLYTGITRAKEELYIICEPDTFEKGIIRQRIKGNTLEQKAEYFKGKIAEEKGWSKLK